MTKRDKTDKAECIEFATHKAKCEAVEQIVKRGRGRPPKGQEVAKPTVQKRAYTVAPSVVDHGVPCIHCGHRYDHKITNTYANGNRRRMCGKCGKPFVTRREKENL